MKALLVDVNKIKLQGYQYIPLTTITSLLERVYPPNNPTMLRLLSKAQKNAVDGFVNISSMNDTLVNNSRNLATSETNEFLKGVYKKAKLSDAYTELAFVIFITGMVNTHDFLVNFEDPNFIVQRLSVHRIRDISGEVEDKRLSVNSTMYVQLMAEMFKVSLIRERTTGIEPLDFVYHMIEARWKKVNYAKENFYVYVEKQLFNLGIDSFSSLKLTKEKITKYYDEIGVLLTSFIGHTNPETLNKLFMSVVREAVQQDNTLLVGMLMTNERLLESQNLIKIGGV